MGEKKIISVSLKNLMSLKGAMKEESFGKLTREFLDCIEDKENTELRIYLDCKK